VTDFRKELVSPDGTKYVSTSPREANDLVFGSGYREVNESADVNEVDESDEFDDVDTEDVPQESTTEYAHGGMLSPAFDTGESRP
jgi:hypothetical protein